MESIPMVDSLYPRRIVSLAAEAPEILHRLGAFDRLVGVSGFARRPAAVRRLPKVGGFSTPDVEQILDLRPDLVIAISDIQAPVVAELLRRGLPVLALNPHRLADVWRDILLIGGAIGRQHEAERQVAALQAELASIREASRLPTRPRVFFEEWPEPLISGIGWVGDLVEFLGGEDLFPELRDRRLARERVVPPEEVAARRPDAIIASWCGKKANLAAIRSRPAWRAVPAVSRGQVYEIPSELILQTGPSLVEGARRLRHLLARVTGGEKRE